ncbi:hypothetical protein ACSBR2_012654 [Camellia fascicularis]
MGGVYLTRATTCSHPFPRSQHDIASSDPPQSIYNPALNPVVSLDQLLVAKSDIDTNAHTLKTRVEIMTVLSNLSCQLQSRTNEVHQLRARLSYFQRMYQETQ